MKQVLLLLLLLGSFSCKKDTPADPAPNPTTFPGTYTGTLFQTSSTTGKLTSIQITTTVTKTNDPNVFQFSNDLSQVFSIRLNSVNSTNAYDFVGLGAAGSYASTVVGQITNYGFTYDATTTPSGGQYMKIQATGSKK